MQFLNFISSWFHGVYLLLSSPNVQVEQNLGSLTPLVWFLCVGLKQSDSGVFDSKLWSGSSLVRAPLYASFPVLEVEGELVGNKMSLRRQTCCYEKQKRLLEIQGEEIIAQRLEKAHRNVKLFKSFSKRLKWNEFK